MKIGIVGLPNVGKSTLFNALTNAGAQSANYPFCTIDPNVGVVAVPDSRLDKLAAIFKPGKVIPAFIEFVDIAGLVRGASTGEGLGNRFLSHIREVDAIAHVVRCFEDSNIVHVEGSVDPVRDIETINLELVFSDLEILERRIDKTKKMIKTGEALHKQKLTELTLVKERLESGIPARKVLNEIDSELLDDVFLLTSKPVIYIANVAEKDSLEPEKCSYVQTVKEYAAREGAEVVSICAGMEEEIAQLDDGEKKAFMYELGLTKSGLEKLITASYSLLGLMSFLTAGPDEVRAWTVKTGTKAPQAAGKIHSDFERGFIRAEVISFNELVNSGSYAAAREKGLVRSEGREYIMKDGDVTIFRFNV